MRKRSRPTKVREVWAKAGTVLAFEVTIQIGCTFAGIREESVDS